MQNPHHRQIVNLIKENSGKGTQHTALDSYLGNTHFRYPISVPVLRKIASDWMKAHHDLTAKEIATLLTALIEGESGTEKNMAGIILDNTTTDQRKFDPKLFDKWLDHLEGGAEVDSIFTGKYHLTEIEGQWRKWKPLLLKFAKSKNINKRRAAIVSFCSPLSRIQNDEVAGTALQIVDQLKGEKAILITKAISWVLRSMERHNRKMLEAYLKENMDTLPKVAVRETLVKLKTGKKTR